MGFRKLVHQGVEVAENLKKRGIKIDSTWKVCAKKNETQNHLMYICRILKEIWSLVPTEYKELDLNQENIL